MSTSEYRSVDAESDLPDQRGGTRRNGQPAVRGQHPARSRQPAADGAGRPARQCARHDGGDLGRRRPQRARRPVPGAGLRCSVSPTSMFRLRRLRARAAAADGAGRPARQRARSRRQRPSAAATTGGGRGPLLPPARPRARSRCPAASCRRCPACWPDRGATARWRRAVRHRVADGAPSVPDLGWSGTPPHLSRADSAGR